MIKHTLLPIFDENSKVLILGSFPSPKARELDMYYGNPQNRFWQVLEGIFGEKIEKDKDSRQQFVLQKHIALWDVVGECDIKGASDSSIQNVIPNDIALIKNQCDIKAVFTTGMTATKLYRKYFDNGNIYLPSTSTANMQFGLDKLIEIYSQILKYL